MYFPRLLDNISGNSTLCDKFALYSLTCNEYFIRGV